MKVKKAIILASVVKIEREALDRLQNPIGVFPRSEKDIDNFKKSSFKDIAEQVLRDFPGDELDENQGNAFRSAFVKIYETCPGNEALVCLEEGSYARAYHFFEIRMQNKWDRLVKAPNERIATLCLSIKQSLAQKAIRDYNKSFTEIFSILRESRDEIDNFAGLQEDLKALRTQYNEFVTFMEGEMQKTSITITRTLNECENSAQSEHKPSFWS